MQDSSLPDGMSDFAPIPQAIALFKLGKLQEAAQMLFDNNPLSLVCAIVCDHDKQCEGHCVKGIKESPVEWDPSSGLFPTRIWSGSKSKRRHLPEKAWRSLDRDRRA